MAAPVREIHTSEYHHGTQKEPWRYGFAEQPPGKEDSRDGIKIYPVGGNDGSKFVHHPRPHQEADHRGDDT